MKGKKTKEEGLPPLAILILITVLIIIFAYPTWDWIIQESIQQHKAMDDFCINEGFKKHTDFKYSGSLYSKSIQIECDGKEIKSAYYDESCIKNNKWGDCTENGFTVT